MDIYNFVLNIFSTDGFMPRWNCGSWSSAHGWLHIASDVGIAAAYFAIPAMLVYFLSKRKDIPSFPVLWLFAAFILTCGIGHFIEATIFWNPWYRLSGLVKAVTALVSLATAAALFKIIPKVLALPSVLLSETESRKWFESIVRATPRGLLVIDKNCSIKFINEQALVLFGWTQQEVEHQSLSKIILDKESFFCQQVERIKQYKYTKFDSCEVARNDKLLGLTKDGQTFPIEIRVRFFYLNEKVLLCTVDDITESVEARKVLENHSKELEERAKELRRSNEDLEAFAHVASHDLKAPLRAIKNLSSWVKKDSDALLPPKSKEHLQTIAQRIEGMDSFLNDLLEYAKTGQGDSAIEILDTRELLEKVMSISNLPQDATVAIQDGMPQIVSMKLPLEQVFINLISNAIKYRDPNRALSLYIGWEKSGELYRFIVRDNGTGIKKQYLGEIFKMFKKFGRSCDTRGSGLGLALVRKIVERHGGQVVVKSEEGVGSEFSFTWKPSETEAKEKLPELASS